MQELDRRTRKTRKAISDAFWKLMQEKDFEDITINDITETADIHRATFYLHYQDKYDWLEKSISENIEICNLGKTSVKGVRNAKKRAELVKKGIEEFRIRCFGPDHECHNLSGGGGDEVTDGYALHGAGGLCLFVAVRFAGGNAASFGVFLFVVLQDYCRI